MSASLHLISYRSCWVSVPSTIRLKEESNVFMLTKESTCVSANTFALYLALTLICCKLAALVKIVREDIVINSFAYALLTHVSCPDQFKLSDFQTDVYDFPEVLNGGVPFFNSSR